MSILFCILLSGFMNSEQPGHGVLKLEQNKLDKLETHLQISLRGVYKQLELNVLNLNVISFARGCVVS